MSDLMKSYLATNNYYLRQRVHSAVIQVARQQRDADGSTGLFARMILADVKQHYEDFILDVATYPDILNNLVIADDHNTVTSTLVPDDDIIAIVNGTFPTAATKYAPTPTSDGE